MCSGSAGGVRGSDAGVRVPVAAHARLRQVPPRQRHVHHCPGDDDDDDDNDDDDVQSVRGSQEPSSAGDRETVQHSQQAKGERISEYFRYR